MKTGRYNKIILEPADKKFIRDNWEKMTNKQLADALGLKLTKLRQFLSKMGLKRMVLEYWTEQQVEFLKDNYKEHGDTELAEIFAVKWHKDKGWSKKHIEKKRRYLKLKRTEKEKQAIQNRNVLMGRFSDCPVKAWETRGNVAEIGEKRIWFHQDKKPFVVIKIKKGFVHYNPWFWEQHFGKVPKGMMVRNKTNKLLDVQIEDLFLVNKSENAILNSKNRVSTEAKKTKVLIRQLEKQIIKNQELCYKN